MAKKLTASLPYENATTGKRVIADMQRILQWASSFGTMEDFDKVPAPSRSSQMNSFRSIKLGLGTS
jgi:hypothetical protein